MVDDELGEEVGALEVDADQFVEAFLGGLGDVGPDAGGHSGVVDEGVEATVVGGEDLGEEGFAVGGGAEVATDGDEFLGGVRREGGSGGGGLLGGVLVPGVVDGDAVAGGGEDFGDAPAQTPARSGDEGDRGKSRLGSGGGIGHVATLADFVLAHQRTRPYFIA